MNRTVIAAPVLVAALFLVGCEGSDGLDGAPGTPGAPGAAGSNGLNSLVNTRRLPLGDATCPGGGRVFETGLDTNRNGVLDAAEVTATEFLECATAPRVRALHASPNAPAVNVLVNGTAVLSDVDYTEGSGFLPAADGARLQVQAIVPGGNAIVIDETLDLDFSTDYTVIAVGAVASIAPLVVANPTDAPIAAGSLRAQVVHGAPNAPAVDVYVTAPGATLASSTPVARALAFQRASGRVQVPAGNYQIRVTLAGNPATVVYDSGELALPAGADLMIVAVENTGPGTTPIQLVALDGTGTANLLAAGTPAAVFAVHASPDAPAVDVRADDLGTATVESLLLAGNVDYAQACRIPAVPAPGRYGISITAAGAPSTVALQFDLPVAPADEFTAIVTGYRTTTPAIRALALGTDTRSVVTESKLRITHASPGTGPVDLYLVPDGTDLNAASTTPAFAAVPFGADTGILSIAPGTYDVYVTPAGNKGTVAIEVQNLALAGGSVLDVIARDADQDGSEGVLPRLIVVDYASVADCTTP